jgi:hypothetical protein
VFASGFVCGGWNTKAAVRVSIVENHLVSGCPRVHVLPVPGQALEQLR